VVSGRARRTNGAGRVSTAGSAIRAPGHRKFLASAVPFWGGLMVAASVAGLAAGSTAALAWVGAVLLAVIALLLMPGLLKIGSAVFRIPGLTKQHLIVLAYLLLMGAAFLPIFEGYDPLREGLTGRRTYELGLMSAALAVVALHAVVRRHPQLNFGRFEIQALLAFVFLGFASALWSLNPTLTVAKAGQLLAIIVASVMMGPLIQRNKLLRVDLPYLVALSALLLIVSYSIANRLIWGTFLVYRESWGGVSRLVLGHAHPLASGNVAGLGAIGLLASNRGGGTKGLLLLPFLAVLWLTSARGPAVGFLAGGLGMALVSLGPRLRRRIVAGVLGICVGLLIIFLSGVDLERLWPTYRSQLRLETLVGLSGRLDLWSYTLERVMERPILGVGYEAGRYILLEYAPWAGIAHNSFLEVLIGTGVVGFVVILIICAAVLRTIARTRDALLVGLTLYMLFYGMTNPVLFVPGYGMALLTIAIVRAVRAQARITTTGW